MIKIYSCDNATEAHFICGLLLTHNIAAEVSGDYLLSAAGVIPIFGGAEASVWIVDDAQRESAEQIIATRSNAQESATWRCAHCGEVIESQFSNCWQCGRAFE